MPLNGPRRRSSAATAPPPPTVLLQAHHAQASATPQLPLGVRLRSGRAEDKPAILRGIWREKLNPLSVDPTRFTVAERAAAGGAAAAVVGFGQIKPLGGDALELASLVVEEAERWDTQLPLPCPQRCLLCAGCLP